MLLSLLLVSALAADVAQTGRTEIAVDTKDTWTVQPLGRDGVLLVGDDDKSGAVSLVRYDTRFEEVWRADVATADKARMTDLAIDGGHAFLLMHRKGAEFGLADVDLATGKSTFTPLVAPVKAKGFGSLLVDGNDAWMVAGADGWVSPGSAARGYVLHLDRATGAIVPVDLTRTGKETPYLLDWTADTIPHRHTIQALVDNKRHRTVWLLDLMGSAVANAVPVSSPAEDDTNILSAAQVPTGSGGSLVVGTYASGAKDLSAQGMYLWGYQGEAPAWRKYHSFTSFEHFFDYLSDARRAQIAKRLEKAEAQGADLDLNYLLRMHPPMVLGDRYVLVGEAYYPEYRQVTTTRTTTVNGVTTTTTTVTNIFVGWRYTHAVVAAFDKQGERLWDASVPIGNVLLPRLRDLVSVSVKGDKVSMLYTSNGKVYNLTADGNSVKGDKGEQRLTASLEEELVKTSWNANSAWWYDDVFLVWGMERLKAEDGAKRTVFAFTSLRPGQ